VPGDKDVDAGQAATHDAVPDDEDAAFKPRAENPREIRRRGIGPFADTEEIYFFPERQADPAARPLDA
jgi:hypothetical protein